MRTFLTPKPRRPLSNYQHPFSVKTNQRSNERRIYVCSLLVFFSGIESQVLENFSIGNVVTRDLLAMEVEELVATLLHDQHSSVLQSVSGKVAFDLHLLGLNHTKRRVTESERGQFRGHVCKSTNLTQGSASGGAEERFENVEPIEAPELKHLVTLLLLVHVHFCKETPQKNTVSLYPEKNAIQFSVAGANDDFENNRAQTNSPPP